MVTVKQLREIYLYIVKNDIKLGTKIKNKDNHLVYTIIRFYFRDICISVSTRQNSKSFNNFDVSTLMKEYDVVGQSQYKFKDSELLAYEESLKALKMCMELKVGQSLLVRENQLFVITEINNDSIKGVLLKEGARTINELDEAYIYTDEPYSLCYKYNCSPYKRKCDLQIADKPAADNTENRNKRALLVLLYDYRYLFDAALY